VFVTKPNATSQADRTTANDTHDGVLHRAAFHNHVHVMEYFIETCEQRECTCRERKNKFGETPLWTAACVGHLDALKCLVSKGSNLDIKVRHFLVGGKTDMCLDVLRCRTREGTRRCCALPVQDISRL